MNSPSHTQRITTALTLVAVMVASACGGGQAASSASSHSTTAKPPVGPCGGERPILYLEGAACADGRSLPDLATSGAGNSWSPTGDLDAFVSANANRLIVRDSHGHERIVYRAPRHTDLVHRPAWSADGSRLAVLLLDEHGFGGGLVVPGQGMPSYRTSLLVLDAQTGAVRTRVRMAPTVVHMPYLMNPPDVLAFSPDGRRVLVSWESAAVADLARGRVHRVWGTPAVAGWTSSGDVLFLDVVDRRRFGALRVWSPSGGEHVVWSARQLRARGIVAEHGIEYGGLRVSPDGSRLAVRTVSGNRTAVELFGLDGAQPSSRIGRYPTTGRIWDFDWSPNGDGIAAVVVDGSEADVRILDTAAGSWSPVATIPITIDGWDTLEALAPIKKLSWNS